MAGETSGLNEREVRMAALEDKSDNPSNLNWCEKIDLEDLLDEEDSKGYRIEEETLDANTYWEIDFSDLFWFPHLIIPRGFEAPEFEKFNEYGDPELHLLKYCEKMAEYTGNELLMVLTFPESLSRRAAAWFYRLRDLTGDEEELHLTPNPVPRGENEVIVEIEEMADIPTLSTLTEPDEEREVHAEQTESPSTTTTKREIHAKQD
uniref:Retrotransposon gag domain-containing protein n=1 Tax=Fagus sylvatica TaxID=28930 RepID=A0A2N9GGH7_FAGSY